MPLRLYNTFERSIRPFIPKDPAHVTFYSCGPTVYDDAHIGNFRSFLAADVLRRFIESPLCTLLTDGNTTHVGPRRVTHVMNITDVGHMTDDAEGGENGEDRMVVAGRRIAEAKKSGRLPAGVEVDPSDPYQIARFYEGRFREDARALGLKISLEAEKDPTLHPRATETIPEMIEVIGRLIRRGCAYVVGEPGSRVVYFDVRTFTPYGALSGNSIDSLKEGEGGRINAANQAQKRHPADFLLWKEDASHIMKWDSPWGKGYPGWHIECTAMAVKRLVGGGRLPEGFLSTSTQYPGAIIDLHSGGEDNIFPHHECEIAQSCCAFCESQMSGSFARMWFHPRFLVVEGTKMSKSKGNFFTARDLFERGIEPAALRLELIRTHYRSNANFTMQGLHDCQRMVDRWRKIAGAPGAAAAKADPRSGVVHDFADALHEDLNIAGALGALNNWVNTLSTPAAEDGAAMLAIDAVLGVLSLERPSAKETEIAAYAPGVTPDPRIEDLLRKRRDARAKKDFKASDAIRDELAAMGLAIKDMAGGRVEVRRS